MALIFDQEDVFQLVGFHIGPKLLGADILTIQEIVRDPKINPIEDAPSFIKGIARLRGAFLPIIDLGQILGITPSKTGERTWVLVAQAGDKSIGYIVDDVTPIIRTKKDAVYQAPELVLSGLRSKYINGVCETESGLLVIVDLNRVLLDEEVRVLNKLKRE